MSRGQYNPTAMLRTETIASERSLIGHLGQELIEIGPERARGRMAVGDHLKQPFGLVHGGAIVALAETLASAATYEGVAALGKLAAGQEISASLLRPISAGHVNGDARCRRQGRTAWIWDVEIRDDDGRLCALVRCTIAVRESEARA